MKILGQAWGAFLQIMGQGTPRDTQTTQARAAVVLGLSAVTNGKTLAEDDIHFGCRT